MAHPRPKTYPNHGRGLPLNALRITASCPTAAIPVAVLVLDELSDLHVLVSILPVAVDVRVGAIPIDVSVGVSAVAASIPIAVRSTRLGVLQSSKPSRRVIHAETDEEGVLAENLIGPVVVVATDVEPVVESSQLHVRLLH